MSHAISTMQFKIPATYSVIPKEHRTAPGNNAKGIFKMTRKNNPNPTKIKAKNKKRIIMEITSSQNSIKLQMSSNSNKDRLHPEQEQEERLDCFRLY